MCPSAQCRIVCKTHRLRSGTRRRYARRAPAETRANGDKTPKSAPAFAGLAHGEDHLVLHSILRFLDNGRLYAGPLRASRRMSQIAARALDPTADRGAAMLWAASNGRVDLVHQLLQDKHVDVTLRGPQALLQATRRGHANVVHALLADPRVDASRYGLGAMIQTITRGSVSVMRALLNCERIDPTAHFSLPGAPDCDILLWAIRNGRTGMVRIILEDGRVDPARGGSERRVIDLLTTADPWLSNTSRQAIIALLLDDARIDPSANNCALLVYAASRGMTDIVQRLLCDRRFDGHTGIRAAAWKAASNGDIGTLRAMAHRLPQVSRDMAGDLSKQAGIPRATATVPREWASECRNAETSK